jgi:hypothetical protein
MRNGRFISNTWQLAIGFSELNLTPNREPKLLSTGIGLDTRFKGEMRINLVLYLFK